MKKYIKNRYALLFSVTAVYLVLSLLVRLVLLFISIGDLEDTGIHVILSMLCVGLTFDLVVALFFVVFYSFYLLLLPRKLIGTLLDKVITYAILSIVLLLMFFGSMAEFPFWEEFGSRFNFIAVDYLIYTYEVIGNINESYPLPLLISGLLLLVGITLYAFGKFGFFSAAFSDKMPFKKRLGYTGSVFIIALIGGFSLSNKVAEFSENRTANELAKNGVFSFFSAFRSNELDYKTFYSTLPSEEAYTVLRGELLQDNQSYRDADIENIERMTIGNPSEERRPNIFLITIESFSAEFLSVFGNTENITPNYDALTKESVFFTNMYATGTRTVRGMEALVLSVPPTPGNSIVRRPDNDNLSSIASVLREKDYQMKFIYGGDGYFDNMNAFFGGQGFDIVDRDRGNPIPEVIKTNRYKIPDNEVSFENAWGICDEDIYTQALKYADMDYTSNRPFMQFIMTTSNHRPYTFPERKIDLEQGSRSGAVKYTDYALGQFIQRAKDKPWFKDSIFIIVADHCASSAGKWEINISKHHIPALVYNMSESKDIDRLVSQIDLMPTVFGYLGWQYNTSLYGKDIHQIKPGSERAFIGNYRTLGVLKDTVFTQLNDRKETAQFIWDKMSDNLEPVLTNSHPAYIKQTISYYQTASERFSSKKMKESKKK